MSSSVPAALLLRDRAAVAADESRARRAWAVSALGWWLAVFLLLTRPFAAKKLRQVPDTGSRSRSLQFLLLSDLGSWHTLPRSQTDSLAAVAARVQASFVLSAGCGVPIASVSDSRWHTSFAGWFSTPPLDSTPFVGVLGEQDWALPSNASALLDAALDARWTGGANTQLSFGGVAGAPLLSLWLLDTTPLLRSSRANASYPWGGPGFGSLAGRNQSRAYADAQALWLASGLAASPARWKLVVGHHDMYGYGPEGSTPELSRLNGIMRRGGAVGYVSGSSSATQLVLPTNAPPFYLSVGGGGGELPRAPLDGSLRIGSAGRGFSGIALNETHLQLTVYDATGKPAQMFTQGWVGAPQCVEGEEEGLLGVTFDAPDARCGATPLPATVFSATGAAVKSPPPPPPAQPTDGYSLSASLVIPGGASWDYVMFEPTTRALYLGRRADGLCIASAADPSGALSYVGCVPGTVGSNGVTFVTTASGVRLGVSVNGKVLPGSATIFLLPNASALAAGASALPPLVLGTHVMPAADGGPDVALFHPGTGALAFTFALRQPAGRTGAIIPYALSADAAAGRPCGGGGLQQPCLVNLTSSSYAAAGMGMGVTGGLEAPRVADASSLYVLLASSGLLARVSLLTQQLVHSDELAASAACGEPSSLDVDYMNGVLLVGCRGGHLPGRLGLAGPLFVALNASDGQVLYSSAIPRHPDGLVYVPPSGATSGRIFLSCGTDSSVIVFEQLAGGGTYRPLETIATRLGAKTLAVDPARRVVYTYAPSGSRRLKHYPTSTDHSKDLPDSASGEAWYPNAWTFNTTTLLAFTPSS